MNSPDALIARIHDYLYRTPELATKIRDARARPAPERPPDGGEQQPVIAALRDHLHRTEDTARPATGGSGGPRRATPITASGERPTYVGNSRPPRSTTSPRRAD